MYDENENKINWIAIIKKLLIVILVILFVFAIITLVKKCSNRKSDKKETDIVEKVNFDPLFDKMQNATLKYLNKDNLPIEINSSKVIKLKYLINKDIIKEIKYNKNQVCDDNTSYSEITRLENNYAIKMQLSCGKEQKFKIIYVGCYSDCKDGGLCLSDENKIGGICVIEPATGENESTNLPNDNIDVNKKPSKPGSSKKPVKPVSPVRPVKPVKPVRPIKPDNIVKPVKPNKPNMTIYYQHQKCVSEYYCPANHGSLVNNRFCRRIDKKTVYSEPKIDKNTTYYCPNGYEYDGQVCYKVTGDPVDTYIYKSFSNTTVLGNNGYKYFGYKVKQCNYNGYCGRKSIKKCNTGYLSSKSHKCITTTNRKQKIVASKPYCSDKRYSYDSSINKCRYTYNENHDSSALSKRKCYTKWSTSKNIDGYVYTGKYEYR